MPLNLVLEWIGFNNMTDKEKEQNPSAKICNGYLKCVENSNEIRQNWWNDLSEKDKREILNIPNFDANKFKEITGIEVRV